MIRQAIIGHSVLHEHTFACQGPLPGAPHASHTTLRDDRDASPEERNPGKRLKPRTAAARGSTRSRTATRRSRRPRAPRRAARHARAPAHAPPASSRRSSCARGRGRGGAAGRAAARTGTSPARPRRRARSPPSGAATSLRSIDSVPSASSLSCATHGSRSSRVFQTSASRPPGRSTRAISRNAGPWSNQWNAWATATTSALASASGIASAPPSSDVDAGQRLHAGTRSSPAAARLP